jgi:Spy/CpxP family protein refolding chaperone
MKNGYFWIFAVAVAAFALTCNAFAQTLEESQPSGVRTVRIGGGEAQVMTQVMTTTDGGGTTRMIVNGTEVALPAAEGGARFVFEGTEGAGPIMIGEPIMIGVEAGAMGGPGGATTMMVTRQAGGGMGTMTISTDDDMFVWNEGFGNELNLTPEQRTNLQNAIEEFRTQRVQGGAGTPPNPNAMRQRLDNVRNRIAQSLNPQQQSRLRELSFQATGGLNSPLLNERMLEFADLTDAQKEQIRKIAEERTAESRAAIQGLLRATPEERTQFATDSAERNKKYAEQIKTVLTPEQKAKAEKLTAEAPALRERLGALAQQVQGQRGQQGQQQGQVVRPVPQRPAPIYTPGGGSWQPGDPVPVQPEKEQTGGQFPREE